MVPRREKTGLWGFRQCEFQTSFLSYRDQLDSLHMILSKQRINNVMIGLRGCDTGGSAPVLFANLDHVFSRRGRIVYVHLLTSVGFGSVVVDSLI